MYKIRSFKNKIQGQIKFYFQIVILLIFTVYGEHVDQLNIFKSYLKYLFRCVTQADGLCQIGSKFYIEKVPKLSVMSLFLQLIIIKNDQGPFSRIRSVVNLKSHE